MTSVVSSRFLAPAAIAILGLAAIAGSALARIDSVEAFVGEPFGVARITASAPPGSASVRDSYAYSVVAEGGRVLYPTFNTGRLLGLLRTLVGSEETDEGPGHVTAFFLFRGDEPMKVTLYTPQPETIVIQPRVNPRQHVRLMRQWWREYNGNVTDHRQVNDYPQLFDTYLTTMLSRRLGLDAPIIGRTPQQRRSDEPFRSLEMILATEAQHEEILRDTLYGRTPVREAADQALPNPIQWTSPELPELDPKLAIEPMAAHVPQEWFYVRFGTFDNYLWMRRLMEEYGGDLGRMITLRGLDYQFSRRLERQLALKESQLARLFGARVVADVALVGRDTFVHEGAAIGMLFHARNTPALKVDFQGQRAAALEREKQAGATEEKVEIAGHEVSFISTPDNQLRSFYASDGDFHLVTTSRAMVERFYEAGTGKGSLGASPRFRYSRSMMPVDRQDTVFLYFSPEFFQGLMSPAYRIELRRRLQATVDIELVQLAKLAAKAEAQPAESVDDLVRGGFLPRGFEKRVDDSGPIIAGNRVIDSLRGARRSFLPVADVKIRGISASEFQDYDALSAAMAQSWTSFDPLVIGIKRYALAEPNTERVVIDAQISPFGRGKYGWLTNMLGPPMREKMAIVAGDVISAQAVLTGGLNGDVYHLFGGLRSDAPRLDLPRGGLLHTFTVIRGLPAYLGAWPKPGILDMLPPLIGGGQPDANGYSQLPLGLWRRQWNGFSVLSFQRQVLEDVAPQLRTETDEVAAQVRLRVADLSQAQAAAGMNALSFVRARETSLGNARLMHVFSEQFRTPRRDALRMVQQLLDTQLVCTLGGEYQLQAEADSLPYWTSTAWKDADLKTYQAPILAWLIAADAAVVMEENKLIARAEVDMRRRKEEAQLELPLFNIFGIGPGTKEKPTPPAGIRAKTPPPAPQPPALPQPPKVESPRER